MGDTHAAGSSILIAPTRRQQELNENYEAGRIVGYFFFPVLFIVVAGAIGLAFLIARIRRRRAEMRRIAKE